MRALLIHDLTPDDAVAAMLETAGHEVVRCNPPGQTEFPCAGMEGRCPLSAPVDVAVLVHDRPSTDLAPGEAGAVCALRDGIPLVVAGNHTHSPFAVRADAVALSIEDVPDACYEAVASAMRRAGDAVAAAAHVDARVSRWGDTVRVTLGEGADERSGVLAHQAARVQFPRAKRIDIERG